MSNANEAYSSDALFFPIPTRADASLPNQLWYFEGVSSAPGSRASLQVVFLAGLPVAGPPAALYATVGGSREDGTPLPGSFLPAPSVKVEGGNGTWEGVGGWTVEQDAEKGKTWVVKFGKEGQDGSGTLKLRSSVPSGHFPSADESQVVSGDQLRTPLLVNGIGWSTTVPGATVEVEATIEGKELKFEGTGFHDTNFAKGAWSGIFKDWYWVRGEAGPYTFVVYHFLPRATNGAWHTSAVLWDAREAAPLVDAWTGSSAWSAGQRATCSPSSAWPATPAEIRPDDELVLKVAFSAGGKQWVFDVARLRPGHSTATVVSGVYVPYGRWTARTSGGAVGGGDGKQEETETGTGSFDWFKFQ